MEKDRLTCYAVTPRALQVVLDDAAPRTDIPEGWFNWIGDRGARADGYAPQRLQLVRFEGHGEAIARWSANAYDAGYDCALIASIDEGFQVEDVQGLRGDVAFCPVAPSDLDRPDHQMLHDMLREPDEAIAANWVAVKLGGGYDIDDVGFHSVTPSQWWAYGEGLREWIAATAKGQSRAAARRNTPDFSRWQWLDGVEPAQLDLAWSWSGAADSTWPWSVNKPCTRAEVAALERAGCIAFWPMRQMPCSGVALHQDGRLLPVGALTSDWAWDTGGLIRAAMERARPALIASPYVPPISTGAISALVAATTRKLHSSFGGVPPRLQAAAASRPQASGITDPSQPSFIEWEEAFGAATLRVRLVAHGSQVTLELGEPLLPGTRPTALRLRESGARWPLEPCEGRWLVAGLVQTDVIEMCRTHCDDGRDGRRFLRDGYELVWSGGETC